MPLREINLNGYIDDAVWFGDEITPEALHDTLYEAGSDTSEDVHIRLNSYGGSCNAATRMYDDLAAYPGKIFLTVSGTAASAATVLAMAADRLEMSPGSLWMIHNPSTVAVGNEQDMREAIDLLKACKDSIINVYAKRCRLGRESISDMMDKTTWMDAQTALMNGFIDGVAESAAGGPTDCLLNRADAEKKVEAWIDRHRVKPPARNAVKEEEPHETEAANSPADADAGSGIAKAPEAPTLAQKAPDALSASASEMDAANQGKARVSVRGFEKKLNNLKHQI